MHRCIIIIIGMMYRCIGCCKKTILYVPNCINITSNASPFDKTSEFDQHAHKDVAEEIAEDDNKTDGISYNALNKFYESELDRFDSMSHKNFSFTLSNEVTIEIDCLSNHPHSEPLANIENDL